MRAWSQLATRSIEFSQIGSRKLAPLARHLGVSPLRASILKDLRLTVSIVGFSANLVVELNELVFSQTVDCKELLNFVVDVFRNRWLVPVLQLEFVYQHAFQLLSLLNFEQSGASRVSHARFLGANGRVGLYTSLRHIVGVSYNI